jgi:hypothetical protein
MSEQIFNADLVVTATAYATHPDGAVVPPPLPAESADPEKE